jgi:predicted DNA-binding transcriptional regulator AlpA
VSLRAVSGAEERIGESLARIERAIQASRLEKLPELAGEIAGWAARIDRGISLRLSAASAAKPPAEPEKLLTAGQVADVLGISEGEVYRRSKSDLKPAAVQLGPGTLRFSAAGIQRFIRARIG